MKSSVTWDSAISVTSSWCLPISCSSRSNGPSKLVSRTVKRDGAAVSPPARPTVSPPAPPAVPEPLLTDARVGLARSLPPQPADQDRVLAALTEVGQQDGDRLAHDAAAVGGHAVLGPQGQPGALQRQQL